MPAIPPALTALPCQSCGMPDADCVEKYRTHDDIPCCPWCKHDAPAMSDPARSVVDLAEDVALAAERLRLDHPRHCDLADELSGIASRLRASS